MESPKDVNNHRLPKSAVSAGYCVPAALARQAGAEDSGQKGEFFIKCG
jgi:hypothetical protein